MKVEENTKIGKLIMSECTIDDNKDNWSSMDCLEDEGWALVYMPLLRDNVKIGVYVEKITPEYRWNYIRLDNIGQEIYINK